MNYRKAVKVVCPYCSFKDTFSASEGRHLMLCDVENGGCDEYFVIHIWFRPEYKVFKLVDATTPEDFSDFNRGEQNEADKAI